MTWTDLIDSAPLWAAMGLAATALGSIGVSWVRSWGHGDREQARDRDMAWQELLGLVKTLKTELSEMRAELDHERDRRREAEDQVGRVRDELAQLRQRLQAQGIVVVPLPTAG